jgi:class 3 adenylate cyclase
MCLFNAPSTVERHPLMAVITALQMENQLTILNENWKINSLPCLEIRIGINSDTCLVGNIGSNDRMNYTALGDSVNIASRCECLNKRYNTTTLIAANTYVRIKDNILCRWITFVGLKGKSRSIHVYEPICLMDAASDRDILICELHDTMKEGLLCHNYEQLRNCCRRLLELDPDNLPAQEMNFRIDRIKSGEETTSLTLCDK